jgi:periplasmic divalent cation tolerance protein
MTARGATARLCDPLPAVAMSVLLVLCACPDTACADALAGSLVEQRLAACVNVLPDVRSPYRWEGSVERAQELMLLIKTTAERFDAVTDHLVCVHPYALPEVLALDVAAGLDRYLDWVRAETTLSGASA